MNGVDIIFTQVRAEGVYTDRHSYASGVREEGSNELGHHTLGHTLVMFYVIH